MRGGGKGYRERESGKARREEEREPSPMDDWMKRVPGAETRRELSASSSRESDDDGEGGQVGRRQLALAVVEYQERDDQLVLL